MAIKIEYPTDATPLRGEGFWEQVVTLHLPTGNLAVVNTHRDRVNSEDVRVGRTLEWDIAPLDSERAYALLEEIEEHALDLYYAYDDETGVLAEGEDVDEAREAIAEICSDESLADEGPVHPEAAALEAIEAMDAMAAELVAEYNASPGAALGVTAEACGFEIVFYTATERHIGIVTYCSGEGADPVDQVQKAWDEAVVEVAEYMKIQAG